MVKHLNIRVYGKVQGVHYRATATETANSMAVKGITRNEKDSSVYIEAEGEEEVLDKFIAWCYMGPPRAKVERIVTEEGSIKNYSNFVIVK